MRFFLLLILVISPQAETFAAIVPADSIGMEKKDGKAFILHKVESKETLYSLSRRYNVSIYQIIENNPPTEFGLDVGQVIKVPWLKQEIVAVPEPGEGEQVHVVKPKETLYSLSQAYNVAMEDIKRWNDLESNALDIGQKLIIKDHKLIAEVQPDEKTVENAPSADTTSMVKGAKTYIVKQGETLYAISKQFDVTISKLRTWNNIKSNEISIGQELIVGMAIGAPVYAGVSTTSGPETPIDPVTTSGQNTGKDLRQPVAEGGEGAGKDEAGSEAVATNEQHGATATEGSTMFEEITESGLAEVIEGTGNTRKYLALHRTATIGTILRVRNEMNDREVFVRVLGRLPDTSVNKNVLIKISKPAYERLGAIDPKFRVSISYIP